MFMGTTYNSIDEKNRLIIPSKLRAELGARCILTKALDQCLNIYTMADWEKQMEKITSLPEADPKIRAFIRHFCGNATECELDKQGRIVIPQELKAYAAVEKELVTIGAMTKIEIWSKEIWDAPSNESKIGAEDFANALMEYRF